MIFIFFETITRERRFDFWFDVGFLTDTLIVDSTKKLVDSSILFIWMRNRDFEITSKKIEKSEKNKSLWSNNVDKGIVFVLFISADFMLFVDINFSFSESNQFSWIFLFFAWTMRVDLFFFWSIELKIWFSLMLINLILRLLWGVIWATMLIKTTIFWFWVFICVFIIFLNFFSEKMMKKKRIVREIQKCRFLKRFFDQECCFLKRNDDALNEILNSRNGGGGEGGGEISSFFYVVEWGRNLKTDDQWFEFLRRLFDEKKKSTLSQYVLIFSISAILIRQFLWRVSCELSHTAQQKWIFEIEQTFFSCFIFSHRSHFLTTKHWFSKWSYVQQLKHCLTILLRNNFSHRWIFFCHIKNLIMTALTVFENVNFRIIVNHFEIFNKVSFFSHFK